ncbi:MAG: hypothetical protein IT204_04665 [Fimbriimonadaceae bacterium]|nr:hypothetical protein [Fimbriimonadaceae bacterium]
MAVAELLAPGAFVVGANYWASHAGTQMWRDWQPAVVEADLQRLAAAGLQVLRVFPLWPDFQPLDQLRTAGGRPVEMRFGEEPLPDDAVGQAGLDPTMLQRFGWFADCATRHRLDLLVGLITGWMSGRFYAPPALAALDALTDPRSLRWQLRFVREFVSQFREHPAVVAWDLGNECNVMGNANRDQTYLWTANIANAIRAADPTRPVVSGMHSLSPTGAWTMADQGELCDLLCTHPYPVFTPHCDQDPVDTIRTILHSTAESRYYADLGGKPCLCQEIGTLGPMIASEEVAARFIRSCLFSLWANDCHGLLWWCANEQTELRHAPYDWHAVERELGLLRVDGTAKPVLETISAFRAWHGGLPFDRLPAARREAVCILTEGQDPWAVAYSSFILAKQAGFDLVFRDATQPLPDAALYLLPSLSGHAMIPRRQLLALEQRIAAGATLYASLDTGLPAGFEPLFGLEPQTRERRREWGEVVLDGLSGAPTLPCRGDFKVRLRPTRATVLGREADGNPVLSVAPYGEGATWFCNLPLERWLTATPGVFHAPDAPPAWRVYEEFSREARLGRAAACADPLVALTEHELGPDERLIVALNQSPQDRPPRLHLAADWALQDVLYGHLGELAANDATVLRVRR